MNINLRALVFGAAVAAALTMTMNAFAAEVQPIRLEGITVVAHRAPPVTVDVVRLDAIVVTAHKAVA